MPKHIDIRRQEALARRQRDAQLYAQALASGATETADGRSYTVLLERARTDVGHLLRRLKALNHLAFSQPLPGANAK